MFTLKRSYPRGVLRAARSAHLTAPKPVTLFNGIFSEGRFTRIDLAGVHVTGAPAPARPLHSAAAALANKAQADDEWNTDNGFSPWDNLPSAGEY